ncbi:DEAD/DEAH box helicase family protein [Caproiciproducens sp.]
MAKLPVKTTKTVVPMIYAYTTPGVTYHEGWTKIGYTERDVTARIKEQVRTANIIANEEWRGTAIFDDGSGEVFTDKPFHAYLAKKGIQRCDPQPDDEGCPEWFKISGKDSHQEFSEFKSNRGILHAIGTAAPYKLRDEQRKFVEDTKKYCETHENGEVLWNAKPRFGKTLSVYDFCKQIGARSVLIVTNRPAIANSWYSDYVEFLGDESGYRFISTTDSLKGKPFVLTHYEYQRSTTDDMKGYIEFVSLQDLKGSIYFGSGRHLTDKLKEVQDNDWDVLVIDEAHEGVDTYKTDVAFDHIKRKFTLHLSGTPFKALANNKFKDQAIFSWTYADEQAKKRDWDSSSEEENPYEDLPKLNLFTYQMSEIIRDEIEQGVEINGETKEYAFNLNDFFETKNGKFVHESAVDKFLDALTTQTKFPFSTEELRNELKHTFWLLNRVDSAEALAEKLNNHEVFKKYKIVLAAGDGKRDDADETAKSFDRVTEAIKNNDKTITLSVGQLTTGVTIPEWTAVLMLSNVRSPALYMQAAFRAQNPCMFSDGKHFYRKENAYVFDFDPARTLTKFQEFANDLSSNTKNGHGDSETREENVRTLLNFFPVLGEDENGEMIELDAENVLSIPRKIKSQEVVKRGFMSNYLFQNISNIFGAPQEVIDIISSFTPVQEPKNLVNVTPETADELSIDENGDVNLDDDYVIGVSSEIFGDKIYGTIEGEIQKAVDSAHAADSEEAGRSSIDQFKDAFKAQTVKGIVDIAKEHYADDIRASDKKQIERDLNGRSEKIIDKVFTDYEIQRRIIEKEHREALDSRNENTSVEDVQREFEQRQKDATAKLQEELSTTINDFVKEASEDVVRTVETKVKEREKDSIEDKIRDHLRGFSRTIPSFLMAYGDNTVTLATFDSVIPNQVFIEVTSITLDQFRFLRDGGKYKDPSTGEEKEFRGNLFDSVVFDDSVKEFLRLKKKLADYFDEKSIEDIFDYIPPQKTNQIFTPKVMVKKMVDMLETENPGCFDMPGKTFIDLYMKSGLYITEIVRRLYQSNEMKRLFPDKEERLKHIFEKQVYGLAPTEIIYKIATNYILGFDDEIAITKHNFRQVDALPAAKEGNLGQLLDELFGEDAPTDSI